MTSIYSGRIGSGWCVYLLRDEAGTVRYVGKGKPSRIEASAKARSLAYEFAAVNLHEQEAYEIEARLINILGPSTLLNGTIPEWPGIPEPVALKGKKGLCVPYKPKNKIQGIAHHASKLTAEAVRDIRRSGDTIADYGNLVAKYGVDMVTIKRCQKRESYKNVPD